MSLDSAIEHLLAAKRISAPTQSYAKDNPAEWAKVKAFLEGAPRPSGVRTEMGLGLLEVEDARRAPAPDPPPDPGSWAGPLTITRGGDYRGAWEARAGKRPITLATLEPVKISGWVRDPAAESEAGYMVDAYHDLPGPGPNLTIDDLRVSAGGTLDTSPRWLVVRDWKNLRIDRVTIDKTRGAELWEEHPQGGATFYMGRVRHTNIQGRGKTPVGNFVQFRSVRSSSIVVEWCEVVNEYGLSNPEDLVSLYQTSNAIVRDCFFHGHYTPGNVGPSSQNGITIESYSLRAQDNRIERNQIVAGHSAAVFAGDRNLLLDNRIVRAGYLTDGVTRHRDGYQGLYVSSSGVDNHARGNRVGFINRDLARQDWTLEGSAAGDASQNVHIPDPITLAVQEAEWNVWRAKLDAAGIVVGASPQSGP